MEVGSCHKWRRGGIHVRDSRVLVAPNLDGRISPAIADMRQAYGENYYDRQ